MKFTSIVTLTLAGVTLALGTDAQETPPNFVVLFADDLGYGDLGCFGHPNIRTPNLDRMAKHGLRLTSFYAQPSCSPARASLLTGRHPFRSGLRRVLGPGSKSGIPTSEITLAEALKDQGYRTAAFGKWHLGHAEAKYRPLANGFDEYFGLLYSNDMIPPWVQTDAPLRLWESDAPLDEAPVDQASLTQRYTKKAVDFIRRAKDGPFFLYVPYSMVHLPVYASEEFRGRSLAGLYGDAVEEIDWSVGEILKTLEQEGVAGRTLTVFASDNGPWQNLPPRMVNDGQNKRWHAGTAGLLRGAKGSSWEGGPRVPAIAHWPGHIDGGRVTSDITSTMDLYTTMISIAGGSVPTDRIVDGVDLSGLLRGISRSPRTTFHYFEKAKISAIREGKWKLRLIDVGQLDEDKPIAELFDLELDASEKYNRAEEFPEIHDAMLEGILAFHEEMEAAR